MSLQLVFHPNEILTKKCTNTEFPTIDEAIESYDIMIGHNGCGIAAPQVGLDKRFFWCKNELCVNPSILSRSSRELITTEGCLSLPEQQFQIKRNFALKVEYYTFLGKHNKGYGKITRNIIGYEAIIFQHEFDHLEGILINNTGERK
jgi:peptide deformylase